MSNLSCPVLPDRAIERLFSRFGAIYGHTAMDRHWAGTPLEDVKSAWAEALGRFGYEDLLRGIRALQDCGKPFPPSLPEFVALCKPPAAPPPEHRRALPVPRRTDDEIAAGRAQMDAIKALLRRGVKRMDESEERTPPPACRCYVGQQRAETMCDACREFVAARMRRIAA